MLEDSRLQLGFNLLDFSRNMPGGLLIYKADGTQEILFASEHRCSMLGCSSMKVFFWFYGKTFKRFVHQDDLERVEREIAYQQGLCDNDHYDYTLYRVIGKDGRWHEFIDVGRLIRNEYYDDVYFVLLVEMSGRARKYFRLNMVDEALEQEMARGGRPIARGSAMPGRTADCLALRNDTGQFLPEAAIAIAFGRCFCRYKEWREKTSEGGHHDHHQRHDQAV